MTMTETSLKARALARIDAEAAEWSAIVAAAEGRLEAPGVTNDWSLKDVAAHLNGWRVDSLSKLEAEAHGESAPPSAWPDELTTDDEINAWIYQQNRDRPAADVLQETEEAGRRLRVLIESLSDDELADPSRFPSLEGGSLGESIASGEFFGHLHDEHEADIRRWLETGHLHHP
jgi:hypothetical protein